MVHSQTARTAGLPPNSVISLLPISLVDIGGCIRTAVYSKCFEADTNVPRVVIIIQRGVPVAIVAGIVGQGFFRRRSSSAIAEHELIRDKETEALCSIR
jgi:hypothetical protein